MWSANESKVMGAAGWFHGKRWTIMIAVFALLTGVLWSLASDHRQQIAKERNENLRKQAELLVTAC